MTSVAIVRIRGEMSQFEMRNFVSGEISGIFIDDWLATRTFLTERGSTTTRCQELMKISVRIEDPRNDIPTLIQLARILHTPFGHALWTKHIDNPITA